MHKREITLLCAVVFLHAASIWLMFLKADVTPQADKNPDTLFVMFQSDKGSANELTNTTLQIHKNDSITRQIKPVNNLQPITSKQKNIASSSGQPDPESEDNHEKGTLNFPKPVFPEISPLPPTASLTSKNQKEDANGGLDTPSPSSGQHLTSKLDLPPSSRLVYNTKNVSNGEEKHGHGQIFWEASKRNFSISGEFDAIDILNFRSEGVIDSDNGLKPNIYIEKQQNELPTNTLFHREQKTIFFATSSTSQQLSGNELDPASAIWHLVHLARYDSGKFSPGATFELRIAGTKGIADWKIEVIGQEEFVTALGQLNSWHLASAANSALDGRRLDIWLASERDWFPVKLRYSGADGSYSEMQIMDIVALPSK